MDKRVPWFLWPLAALLRLLAFVVGLTGRLIAGVLGLILMAAGAILIVFVIPAPVGFVIVIVGFLLLVRSLF